MSVAVSVTGTYCVTLINTVGTGAHVKITVSLKVVVPGKGGPVGGKTVATLLGT